MNPYKEFISYKARRISTFVNLLRKIGNLEDLRYAWGLVWFARRFVFKRDIDNETVRGR